ncbi:MAG: Hsp20 family protein [Candidatus Omnitrophica bacterium]|nr:Hsp20 family protein [Candidatus Omnitrophota bacterium]
MRHPQTFLVMAVVSLMLCTHSVFADDNVQDLKKQIEELKAKVATLEANQSRPAGRGWPSPHPSFDNSSWDPFAEMQGMHEEMNRMFRQAFDRSSSPTQGMFSDQLFFDNSNIQETKDGYLIKLDIDGFDKNKINVSAKDGVLGISGEYNNDKKQNDQNGVVESHNYAKFLNSMPLPKDADISKMKTEQKGDQLEISFPKKS